MNCYFARKNAIRKDPMETVSKTLAFGLEICFVVAVGLFIMQASPEPAADYHRAAKAAQGFVVMAAQEKLDG